MPWIHPFNVEIDSWAINKLEKLGFLRWLTDQLSMIQSQCIERGTFNLKLDNTAVSNAADGVATKAYTGFFPAGGFTRDNTEVHVHMFGSSTGTTEKQVFFSYYGVDVLETHISETITTHAGEPIQLGYSLGELTFSTPDVWSMELFLERGTTDTLVVFARCAYDGNVTTQLSTVTQDLASQVVGGALFIRDTSGAAGTITKLHGSAKYRRAS